MKRTSFLWVFAAVSMPLSAVAAQHTGKTPDSAVGGYELEVERAPSTQGAMPSFRTIDTDNSGFIDEQEAKAVTGLQFNDADADNDGKLSSSELEAAMKVRKDPTPGL